MEGNKAMPYTTLIRPRGRPHWHLPGILLVVAFVVTVLAFSMASARSAGPPTGAWTGLIDVSGRKVSLTLNVADLKPGKPAGTLAWGAPHSCEMQTEYVGQQGASYLLGIVKTNAPWCDLYWNGQATLALKSATKLDLRLVNRKGERPLAGELMRTGE